MCQYTVTSLGGVVIGATEHDFYDLIVTLLILILLTEVLRSIEDITHRSSTLLYVF